MSSSSLSLNKKDRPRVLVVDNEQYLRTLAKSAMEEAGFAVYEARDGAKAIEIFNDARPDIVMLDVSMPVMDGFETCAALRALPAGQHVPILMMTGRDDLESIKRAYQAGATDFVVKPINWVILGHRAEYMLRASSGAEDLRASQAKLANAQRIARLGYWEWNLERNELTCSEDMHRIFGLEADHRIPSFDAFLQYVHNDDRGRLEQSLAELLDHREPREAEYRVLRPGGSECYVEQQAELTLDVKGRPARITCTVQDVTERKNAEERIRFLAYYDALTDLPNRRSFAERLSRALSHAHRRESRMAVLFLDLDRFKRINDSLGHTAGDQLLQEVAERLLGCVRATDTVSRPVASDDAHRRLVARLGGDEFVVLLSEVSDGESAAIVARRLVDSFDDSFTLNGQEVFLTSSIGISLYPEDGENADTLIKNADTAMYHAKDQGGNNFQYYTESMNATSLERLVLESSLGKALERDEFVLFYQPQYDVVTRRVTGAEALIRWQHPEKGLLAPGSFIPLAEKTGLIGKIDEWVLRAACKQARSWRRAGLAPVRIAVNLSSRQFEQEDFPNCLAKVLEETGQDPAYLDLEVTESTLMQEGDETVKTLRTLKSMGVRLSIDDFGTGYSSLSYLMRFPVDALKIDRSFLKGVPADEEYIAVTSAIIAMAKSLKLQVVAEGVEEESQVQFLRDKSCDEMQGFLLSKPVPADEFARLVKVIDRPRYESTVTVAPVASPRPMQLASGAASPAMSMV